MRKKFVLMVVLVLTVTIVPGAARADSSDVSPGSDTPTRLQSEHAPGPVDGIMEVSHVAQANNTDGDLFADKTTSEDISTRISQSEKDSRQPWSTELVVVSSVATIAISFAFSKWFLKVRR